MASDRLRLAIAALSVASLLSAASAHADPTASDRETARTMMAQGRELRGKGDLPGALKRFKAADEIMHVPTTAFEVARTQVSLGLLVEALDSLAEIRHQPESARDPEAFKQARVNAQELLVSLQGRVPALTVVVHGAADGARPAITIDGVKVPPDTIGLPRSVDPGHHVVVVETSTGQGRQEVDVREGEQKPVEVTLSPRTPPAAPPGETAAPAPEAPPEPPEPVTIRSHRPTALTYVGFALAGVGVVVGTTTGLLELSKASSLDGACPRHICGPSSYSDLDAASSLALVSDLSFAAAGAGAVVAVVSMLVGHEETSPPPRDSPADAPAAMRVRAAPWIGLGAAGVRGTF